MVEGVSRLGDGSGFAGKGSVGADVAGGGSVGDVGSAAMGVGENQQVSSRFGVFSDWVRLGSVSGVRWFWGSVFVLTFWVVFGSLLTFLFAPAGFEDVSTVGGLFGFVDAVDSWRGLLFFLVGFVPLFVGVLLGWVLFIRMPLSELFVLGRAWSWRRVWFGFWLWGVLLVAGLVPVFVFNPESVVFVFSWGSFWLFAVVALLLFPVQTTAEELLFRGWFLRLLGQYVSSRVLLSVFGGVLFVLPHLSNPEAVADAVGAGFSYFVMGFMLCWVTVRDKGLELAVGAHLVNNILAGVVFPYEGSVLPTEGVFLLDGGVTLFQTVSLVAAAVLFIWFTCKPDRVMVESSRLLPLAGGVYDFDALVELFDGYTAGRVSEEEFVERKRSLFEGFVEPVPKM